MERNNFYYSDLIRDSKCIKFLLTKEDFIWEDEILNLFPRVNFDLLIKYYRSKSDAFENKAFENEDLLKLVEDMHYLDCGDFLKILIEIKSRGIKFDKFDDEIK